MTKICEFCKREFPARAWNAGRFCSRTCMWSVSPADRFWSRVDRSDPDGCWTYRAANKNRHQTVAVAKGVFVGAHRYAYELTHGKIPDGLYVCHSCDLPSCVRPDHLFLGTQGDNIRDMFAKGRGHNARRVGL